MTKRNDHLALCRDLFGSNVVGTDLSHDSCVVLDDGSVMLCAIVRPSGIARLRDAGERALERLKAEADKA